MLNDCTFIYYLMYCMLEQLHFVVYLASHLHLHGVETFLMMNRVERILAISSNGWFPFIISIVNMYVHGKMTS